MVDACATREQVEQVHDRISTKADFTKVETLEEEIANNYYLKDEATEFKDDCDI